MGNLFYARLLLVCCHSEWKIFYLVIGLAVGRDFYKIIA